jgi:hypothetical protein
MVPSVGLAPSSGGATRPGSDDGARGPGGSRTAGGGGPGGGGVAPDRGGVRDRSATHAPPADAGAIEGVGARRTLGALAGDTLPFTGLSVLALALCGVLALSAGAACRCAAPARLR